MFNLSNIECSHLTYKCARHFYLTRATAITMDPFTLIAILESFVDANDHNGVIEVNTEIKLLDLQDNEACALTITTPQASIPERGLISCFSPLGSALLNKKKGDIVEVSFLGSRMRYQILEINMSKSGSGGGRLA